jgi:phage terminase large subunit GpA-like protein
MTERGQGQLKACIMLYLNRYKKQKEKTARQKDRQAVRQTNNHRQSHDAEQDDLTKPIAWTWSGDRDQQVSQMEVSQP